MARYQPRHSRGRAARRATAITVLLLGALAGTGMAFRTDLLAAIVTSALTDLGLAPVEMTVTQTDLSGFKIETLRAGGGQIAAREITGEYSLASLWDGRLLSLSVDGLMVRADWRAEGIDLAGLQDVVLEPQGPAAIESLRFPVDVLTVSDARAVMSHPAGPVTLSGGGVLRSFSGDFDIDGQIGVEGPGIEGALETRSTYSPQDVLASDVSGQIRLDVADFRIPGSETALSVAADMAFAVAQGRADIILNRDFNISGPWPDILPALPDATRRASVTLARAGTDLSVFSIEKGASGLRLTTDLQATWDTPLGGGELGVAGWTALGANGFPEDFAFRRLAAKLDQTPTAFGVISGEVTADAMRGPVGQAAGSVGLTLQVAEGRIPSADGPGAEFASAELKVRADAGLDGLMLTLTPVEMTAEVRGLSGWGVHAETPVRVALDTQAEHPQTITIPLTPGVGAISAQLAFTAAPTTATVVNINSSLSFDLEMPVIITDGAWVLDQNIADIRVSARDITASSALGVLDGLSITARADPNGITGDYVGRATRAAAPRPTAPRLAIQGQFEYANNIFSNQLDITSPSGRSLGRVEGGYNLANGYVSGRLSTGRLSFGGTGLGPSDLRPLALPFTPVSGQVAIEAEVQIDENDRQSGSLFVQDLEVESPAGRFEQINTVVTLTSVWPPQSEPNQTAAIGLLQAGVPITNMVTSFAVSPMAVTMDSLTMEFASGTIRGEPMQINLDSTDSSGTFTVTGVKMPEIARLSGLKGLETTGTLSGTVPVRISGADIYILEGTLKTESPGVISFRPDATTRAAAAGQGGMTLAMEALENFQYDSIAMTLTGSLNKDLEAAMAIKGRNPDLYGGYPIDFNLSLSGELANVLRDSLAGYRVPETIKQQLLEFPGSLPPTGSSQ